jgi:hypothetical protein
MIRYGKYALVVLLLSGCSTMAGIFPSVHNCNDVYYLRHYQDVTIQMKCVLTSADKAPDPVVPEIK